MNWISKDGKIILVNRAIRSLAHGFLAVLFGIYLKEIGFQIFYIGLLLSITLIGSSIFTIIASKLSVNFGIRKMILISLILSIFGLSIFLITENFYALILGTVIAFLSPTGRELGPFLSLDQAYLPHTADSRHRTRLFSIYNIISGLSSSIGFLMASLPIFLQKYLGLEKIASFKFMFLLYIIINIISLLLYSRISEVKFSAEKVKLSKKTKKIVTKLCILYAMDSFSGGFIVESIVSLWFNTTFNLSISVISLVFAIGKLLESVSFYISHKISEIMGLIKTMAFTHFISNIFIILVPFSPNMYIAIIFYSMYMLFSQMDVPPRQSYIVAIVEPEEKPIAASYTNVTRVIATSVGPAISGKLLHLTYFSPFVFAGVIKIIYDIALLINFSHIKPPEEEEKTLTTNH